MRCYSCMKEYDEELGICPFCGYHYSEEQNVKTHIIPGTLIYKRYTVGVSIGQGGFGVTYIGWDNLLEKVVAIKEYLPSEFSTRVPGATEITIFEGNKTTQFKQGKGRFIEEAQKLALFNKENGIITVYDTFEENSTAYLVMDYYEGETLSSKIKREGKVPIEDALNIIVPILKSLQEVHNEGIIHRDISPDNIYITTDGQIKLLDFGAARYASTDKSRSLTVILKPGFAPEEQYHTKGNQGPWSDVYAIAATLYYMITGLIPPDAMERTVKDEIVFPKKIVNLSSSLNNAIMNALVVNNENRTQSVNAFEEQILAEQVRLIFKRESKGFLGIPLWAKLAGAVTSIALAVLSICVFIGVIDISSILGNGPSQILPDGTIEVPGVINKTKIEAEKIANKNHLLLQITGKEVNDQADINTIMQQDPKPGAFGIAEGVLNVVISAGKEQFIVPDVTYFQKEDAKTILENIGFKIEFEEVEDTSGKFFINTVMEQSEEANSYYSKGGTITLKVCNKMKNLEGDGIVPNILKLSVSEAQELLKKHGLFLNVVEEKYDNEIGENHILSQIDIPDSNIGMNKAVHVVRSLGKKSIVIPDLLYKSYDDVIDELDKLGIKIKVEYKKDDTVAIDHVINQSKKAGDKIYEGEELIIVISKGSEKQLSALTTQKNNQDLLDKKNSTTPTKKPEESGSNSTISQPQDKSTIILYRYRTRSKGMESTTSTNANMSGWEQYDKKMQTSYSNWSEWQYDAISTNAQRQVENQVIYRYYYFVCSECGYHLPYWNSTGGTQWSGSEICPNGYNHLAYENSYHEMWDALSYNDAGGSAWGRDKLHTKVKGEACFWDRRPSEQFIRKLYRYRAILTSTTYYYRREVYTEWSSWSAWTEVPITKTDLKDVETKTESR